MEPTQEIVQSDKIEIRLSVQELDWLISMLMHGNLPANYSTTNAMIQNLVGQANQGK